MRTTIRLKETLLKAAKQHALKQGSTLTKTIEDALIIYLSTKPSKQRRKRLTLRTVNGKGLHSGVDLDNSADLLDLMEER